MTGIAAANLKTKGKGYIIFYLGVSVVWVFYLVMGQIVSAEVWNWCYLRSGVASVTTARKLVGNCNWIWASSAKVPPQCFQESVKYGTSTTATLAAHCTYKRTENNLSQGCKFDPFLGSLVLAGTGGNASKCVLTRVQLRTKIRTRLWR
jgi:hypothetical protein